jgi:arsenate reductase
MAAWQDEVRKLRERRPTHLLFLCLANSVRSQLAEGLARSLAPGDVRISSAGAYPAGVHALAIEALVEVGIDAGGHHSKGIDEIDLATVDTVITLCADPVCPALPGDVAQLHWPMPDPTAHGLAGFRELRDELQCRLAALFE